MERLISVIIPVFNRENVIQRAINSVLDQTFSNLEIIVWDDGSTDQTAEKVKAIQDPRVRFFSAQNRGVAAARNLAVQNSSGEWVAFLDSDDEWNPEKLNKQVQVLNQDPDVDLIFSSAMKRYGEDQSAKPTVPTDLLQKLGIIEAEILPDAYLLGDKVAENIFNFALSIQSVLVRKRTFLNVGGFNESLRNSEDREFWWRLVLSGAKIACITAPLVTIHRSKKNLSSYSKKYLENHLRSLEMMIATAKKMNRSDLIPFLKTRLAQMSQEYIRTYSSQISFLDFIRYGLGGDGIGNLSTWMRRKFAGSKRD